MDWLASNICAPSLPHTLQHLHDSNKYPFKSVDDRYYNNFQSCNEERHWLMILVLFYQPIFIVYERENK